MVRVFGKATHHEVVQGRGHTPRSQARRRIAEGRGSLEPGGGGRIRIDVRTLAALYTGFVTPVQARIGLGLECTNDEAARLASVFAGALPWMQDGF